ncbi:hypothetical protein DL93DRAFT_89 [Clavulina sp. PMI_390]|nr:hypothetical protein DL93DRAFT_89 [Clavulina sp. PMI_390]
MRKTRWFSSLLHPKRAFLSARAASKDAVDATAVASATNVNSIADAPNPTDALNTTNPPTTDNTTNPIDLTLNNDPPYTIPPSICYINKLPLELLTQVFLAVIYSSSFRDSEIFLSSITCVDSQWKDLVMSLPALWSRIDISDYNLSAGAAYYDPANSTSTYNRISRHIDRSQDHDLDILINRNVTYSYVTFSRLMERIFPHLGRAVRLEIHVNDRLQLRDLFPLMGQYHIPSPFPRLRSFQLVGSTSKPSMPQIFAEPAKSAIWLTDLIVHGVHLPEVLELPCHNVRNLDVVSTITLPRVWERFAKLVQRCDGNSESGIDMLRLGISYRHEHDNAALPFSFEPVPCRVRSLASSGFTFCWLIDVNALEEFCLVQMDRVSDHHTLRRSINRLNDTGQLHSLWRDEELYPLAKFFAKDSISVLRLDGYGESSIILFILLNTRVPSRFRKSESPSTEQDPHRANRGLIFPHLKQIHLSRIGSDILHGGGKAALNPQHVIDLLDQRPELSVYCQAVHTAWAKDLDRLHVSADPCLL